MNSSVLAGLPTQLSQAPDPLVGNLGRITLVQYKIITGIFFGIAVLSFLGRIFIRLFTRRRLYIDDGFLSFAFATLCGGTVLGYLRIYIVYLQFAVLQGDLAATEIVASDPGQHARQFAYNLAYIVLLWTTVFAVKWCYLAFFHPLLVGMSRGFVFFYWFTIGASVVAWILSVAVAPVIPCPYVGMTAVMKCFPTLPVSHSTMLAMFWIPPILDALTDLMIISIPIRLLYKVQVRTLTKVGLGCFLCLSIFMCVCSIIRTAGTYYHGALDYPWQVFWLHLEGCIGVTMGSITVYRSTLIGSNEVSAVFKKYITRMKGAVRGSSGDNGMPQPEEESKTERRTFGLPSIPQATISGLRTWDGRSRRDNSGPDDAGLSSFASGDFDYHALLKAPKTAAASRYTRPRPEMA
ncbi:hypothetical protein BO70DRAFT_402066 [Aspergillus heteromorphus CBS 117.55]|uniref:Rhodopsin domain-containing protein n=1 Tax=Aspergillus heteromorphus CBS 117.55 TaxID=1448321 RepID=A0A317X6M0_9EURO|nr:uncharacterized protein BO70DRAFT_402066 [Aspergillus heteromorphus CBS 117.55]PWY92220.1 hypothetical protein BO70DRAFT_402066 [Aspergillus heteromorphus CBS 117.55]